MQHRPAGLDFGTSNSVLAIAEHGVPRLLPMEGDSPYLPSALYVSRHHDAVDEPDERSVATRLAEARQQQAAAARAERRAGGLGSRQLDDAELEQIVRAALRREAVAQAASEAAEQTLGEALRGGAEVGFGRHALRMYLDDPTGFYVRSPKSFLGADISAAHLQTFEDVVARILGHMRATAIARSGVDITQVVMGRLVHFQRTRQRDADAQAVGLLERAARTAGFTDLAFQFEPVAAALDFERTLTQETIVLVLDAGGGTTDCSVIRLGPDHAVRTERTDDLLGSTGDRFGGLDVDIALAWRTLMPLFGKNDTLRSGLPMPHPLLRDAVTINDVAAQRRFHSAENALAQLRLEAADPRPVDRLLDLLRLRGTHWLVDTAERAKIGLSDHERLETTLDRIEPGLVCEIARDDLEQSSASILARFLALMREALTQAAVDADVIFVTGGTARSPIVQSWLRRHFPTARVVNGDSFGSVASGLALQAARDFGPDASA